MTAFRHKKCDPSSTEQAFVERLNELFEYDPETGELFWKRRPAGTLNQNGYVYTIVDGKQVSVHRVIFALMTGAMPTLEVDHKNRIRSDNRWENLRELGRSDNAHNTGIYSTNTTGHRGVSFYASTQKYHASIIVKGKRHNLGSFRKVEDAAEAVRVARKRLVGDLS